MNEERRNHGMKVEMRGECVICRAVFTMLKVLLFYILLTMILDIFTRRQDKSPMETFRDAVIKMLNSSA